MKANSQQLARARDKKVRTVGMVSTNAERQAQRERNFMAVCIAESMATGERLVGHENSPLWVLNDHGCVERLI